MSPEMMAALEKAVGVCQPKYGLKDGKRRSWRRKLI